MSWQDDLNYMRAVRASGFVGTAPRPRPTFGSRGLRAALAPSSLPSYKPSMWGQIASGAMAPPRAQSSERSASSAFPERVDISLPTSSQPDTFGPRGERIPPPPPRPPEQGTQGDLLGSFGAAFGSTFQGLNFANAIPWAMERIGVAADALADANIPVASDAARFAAVPTDAFLSAVKEISGPVGDAMNGLVDWTRDFQLSDRANAYRALVTGDDPTSLATWANRQILDLTLDKNLPNREQVAQAILRDAVDLPESVKAAIERNPNGDLDAYLNAAPEGRQFSYQPGIDGIIKNGSTPLAIYFAEYMLGGAIVRGARTALVGGVAGGNALLPIAAIARPAGLVGRARAAMNPVQAVGTRSLAATLGRQGAAGRFASGALQTGVGATARAVTAAAALQKYAAASGVGYAAVSTVMDGIARYQGYDAAVRWFDQVNRTTKISDDPRVQLVTGFSVNPFEAVGLAKRGILRLGRGAGDVTVGKALGTRFQRYYDHETLLYEQVRRMYKLGSVDEAREFVARNYESRGEAFDEVVGVAADVVLDRLPKAERIMLNAAHTDPVARTKAVLTSYPRQIMEVLEKEPDVAAARWYQHAWEYHEYDGPFNPELARLNSRDYRAAMERTYDFRARNNAVVGYTELVPPRGQAIIEQWIDRVADAEGQVRVGGIDGLDDLVRQFPALRKYKRGLVPAGATMVPRETLEAILQQARDDYALTARQNPVKARTGADPILRPDSPTRRQDYAEALGTEPETIRALEEFKFDNPDAGDVETLRAFIAEKMNMEPELAAGMSPQQVWEAASDYVDMTTRPWADLGEAVMAAEKRLTVVRAELARLAGLPAQARGAAHADRTAALERELSDILTLVRTASDPVIPFAERVTQSRSRARTAKRIREMNPDGLTEKQTEFLRSFVADRGVARVSSLEGRALHEAAMQRLDEGAFVATATEAHLAELALRKVQALDTLKQLATIDDAAMEILNPAYVGEADWTTMLNKTPEGEWAWRGNSTTVPFWMRKALKRFLEKEGGKDRFIAPRVTETMGDYEFWTLLSRNPEWVRAFSKRQRMFLAQAKRGNSLDEVADRWMKDYAKSSDDVLDELVRLREARDEILDGRSAYNVRRTARAQVPEVYVTEAEGALGGQTLYYDPEFETIVHPANVSHALTILNRADELYIGLREVVNGDPLMRRQVERLSASTGVPVTRLLQDPVYAPQVRSTIIPADFEPPVPGMVPETTELDFLIRSEDKPALMRLSEQLANKDAPAEPVKVPLEEAQAAAIGRLKATLDGDVIREGQEAASRVANIEAGVARGGSMESGGAIRPSRPAPPPGRESIRPSTRYRRELSEAGADLTAAPDAAILDDPANHLGLEVLSVLNHGTTGTRPATVRTALSLLRLIEDGSATRMGIGPALQAEGQKVARAIIRQARADARRQGIPAGVFTKGLDPAMLADDELELARALSGLDDRGRPLKGNARPLMTYDEADPLGTLQYGLKKRPRDAVVMEWAAVPGLAEEFLAGNFKPWQERVWNAHIRQAWNWTFGPRSNTAIAAEARGRFIERAHAQGVDQRTAEAIWDRWRKVAVESRETEVRRVPVEKLRPKGSEGPAAEELVRNGKRVLSVREHVTGDNPLYASVRNIPTLVLDRHAHEVIEQLASDLPANYRLQLRSIDYGGLFREATSVTRRTLADAPIPLGQKLAAMYGAVAHNRWVTTAYYLFRFASDIRFAAMNFFEGQFLYAGRAGLRRGEIDEGMFGMTEDYLRKLDENPMDNTGYAHSRSRGAYAYRTFLKEQPERLRAELRGMASDEPELMEAAIREIAARDPELSKTILMMGDDVDGYLVEMDRWYKRMLNNVDEAEDAATIDEAIAQAAASDPAMAEVYGRLAQVNKDLWTDVRQTFYGNAERSRAERVLNSWLLYWPLSYQIKATKWLARVMFDRAGGLQTNAAGAVVLDRLVETHNRLVATDVEYRDWFEKHPTLVFTASMFFPMTWDSIGVSLNPALRSIFFERDKSIFEIGPVYTFGNLVPQLGRELYVDLYPTFKDVPFMAGVYRAVTGNKTPEPPTPGEPVATSG